MKKTEMQYEAAKALQFLNEHPAFINCLNDSFLGSQCVTMYACCKNGIAENSKNCVIFNKNEKGWERFKNRFKKGDDYIYIDYKDKYGCPWVYDHVEYFYEADFFTFIGDINDKKSQYDFKNYMRYHGFVGVEKSFEKAIISCKDKVVEMFGNFSAHEMLTKKEKDNNKKENAFFLKKIKNGLKGDKSFSEMISNPKYIFVSDAEINLRWLKWYSKTDDCIKSWGNQFDKLVENVVWDDSWIKT